MFFNPLFQLIELIIQLFFWGLIIIAGVFAYRAISKSGIIPEEEIIERWSAFLTDQADKADEFLTMVESELDVRGCPYDIGKKTFMTGFVKSNPFVKIKLNFAYSCYVGYEAVGKDIYLTWSIREKISFIYRIPLLGPVLYRIFHVVSFIDRNKLLAFASFTKDCTENAVEAMADKYKIEKPKMAKASSGKLGPL